MANFLDTIFPGSSMIADSLTPDLSGAQNAAEFRPYNIASTLGRISYDPAQRKFISTPHQFVTETQSKLFDQYRNTDEQSMLDLYRQQAAPYNEANRLGLENRLFSQGLLGASKEYDTGSAMRSLFDSQNMMDLNFQTMARQQAQQAQQNYLQQILGLNSIEGGLFNQAMGLGGIGMQGQLQQSNLQAQNAAFMPNAIWSILGAGTMGFMGR